MAGGTENRPGDRVMDAEEARECAEWIEAHAARFPPERRASARAAAAAFMRPEVRDFFASAPHVPLVWAHTGRPVLPEELRRLARAALRPSPSGDVPAASETPETATSAAAEI